MQWLSSLDPARRGGLPAVEPPLEPPWSPLSWNPRSSCCRQGSQRTLAWAAVLSVVIPFLTAVSALFVDFHLVFLASMDVSTDASALHARGASERKNHQTVIFWSAAKGGAALDDAGRSLQVRVQLFVIPSRLEPTDSIPSSSLSFSNLNPQQPLGLDLIHPSAHQPFRPPHRLPDTASPPTASIASLCPPPPPPRRQHHHSSPPQTPTPHTQAARPPAPPP